MSWLQALVLAVVQGLTEFLPISSSGHLRVVSELFFGEDAGASFTAVTQIGTELAVVIYFAADIARLSAASAVEAMEPACILAVFVIVVLPSVPRDKAVVTRDGAFTPNFAPRPPEGQA